MKFDGNILDGWFQDKLSREKVKLSGRSGKLAESARRVGVGLKVVAQALSVKYSRVLRRMVISRVGRIVEGNRESFIVFTLLFIKSNEVQTKLRYVRLLLLYGYIAHPVEHRTFNAEVEGSSPSVPTKYMGEWQSGQLHLTVNQASSDCGGSNPSSPTNMETFPQRLWRGVRVILSDLSGVGSNPAVSCLGFTQKIIFPSSVACYPKPLDDRVPSSRKQKGRLRGY